VHSSQAANRKGLKGEPVSHTQNFMATMPRHNGGMHVAA
jgi:hypothetical protein